MSAHDDFRVYVDVNGECCEECGAVHVDAEGRPYLYPDGSTFVLRCKPCLERGDAPTTVLHVLPPPGACQLCDGTAFVKVKLEAVDGRVLDVRYYCLTCVPPAFPIASLALAGARA